MIRQPFAPPSYTTAQRDALGGPGDGAVIWNSTVLRRQMSQAGAWVNLPGGYLFWQHPRGLAIPNNTFVPQPWNSPLTDPFALSPGFQTLTSTIAAASDGAVLPQATIHLASIPVGPPTPPTSGFVVITGPSGLRTVADGVTTNGSPTVTSATAAFVAGDVHSAITGANIPSPAYIGVRNSATSIGLSSSATANVPLNATGTGAAITLEISSQIDTLVGYTAISAPDLTGCNSTGGVVFQTGISTGTLATGQIVTWANVQFNLQPAYIWAGLAVAAFAANATGYRAVRWRDASAGIHLPGTTFEAGSLNIANQHVPSAFQPASGLQQIELYQNSGGVLNSTVDGIQSPALMAAHASPP